MRSALIAGPGGPVDVDDTVLVGALRVVTDEQVISEALADAGHVDLRRRLLTGMITVVAVLGLCLFRRESYELVLGRVVAGVPRVVVEGLPTAAALSKARTRLATDAMRAVFEHAAARMPTPGVECFAFDLLVTAFDGTVFDLANTTQVTQVFAIASGGRYPQARMVALVVCGNRWITAARVGSCATSEQALVDTMAPDVPCPRCGHRPSQAHDPVAGLVAAITTQPLNRIDRQRTAPRTKRQRQTERTRDVVYEINIVLSNLPREDETACVQGSDLCGHAVNTPAQVGATATATRRSGTRAPPSPRR